MTTATYNTAPYDKDVYWDRGTGAFVCKHCKKTYPVTLPVPLTIFAVVKKNFERLHQRCKAPVRIPEPTETV